MKTLPSVLVFFGALLGCAAPEKAPEPKAMATVKCTYPVISPLPETRELQEKGGVSISLAPGSFQCTKAVARTSREVAPTFGESMQLASSGGNKQFYRMVESTNTPVYKVNPEKVAFRVKITNQMPRVFRGSGTVVLYNFGGKNASISSNEYGELTNILIPPRASMEVTIYGPTFQQIPEKTTLGIFLYDVVTKTDNAGNIVEKQNYEWYYAYQVQVKEEAMEVSKSRQWMKK
jgi:hypothetical protein